MHDPHQLSNIPDQFSVVRLQAQHVTTATIVKEVKIRAPHRRTATLYLPEESAKGAPRLIWGYLGL